MIDGCSKCNLSTEGGSTLVEGGQEYYFCPTCTKILDSQPNQTMFSFLGPKKESWVARNIREARERRARGQLLWK